MGARVTETASPGRGGDFQGTANCFKLLWVVGYTDAYVDVSELYLAMTFVPKTLYRLCVDIIGPVQTI